MPQGMDGMPLGGERLGRARSDLEGSKELGSDPKEREREREGEMMHSLLVSLVAISSLLLLPGHCKQLNVRDSNSTTAYEILEEYGFPAGLLPSTVSGYELDEDDGAFKLYLESTCTVNIPNLYPIKYKSTITGYITSGKISSLSGVTVKVLFIWWSITSISVSGENLVFKVGPASASYAITNFDESPVCAESNPFHQSS